MKTQKDIIRFFLKKGILLTKDLTTTIDQIEDLDRFYDILTAKIKSDSLLVLDKDLHQLIKDLEKVDFNLKEFEKAKVKLEKGDSKVYDKFVEFIKETKPEEKPIEKDQYNVKVIFSYKEESKKREIQDFVSFFNQRYKFLEKLLQGRQDLQNLTSINRIKGKKERSNLSLIGMVSEKSVTKNGNLLLNVEDPTGFIKVLVNKNKAPLFNLAKNIVLDEVIGINGVNGDNIVFANSILWPDIPLDKELKKSKDDIYAVFISDFHIGSSLFLKDNFNRFIKWANGQLGDKKQKEIANKTKYIFIVGDLIDGCGIYPEQDKELIIKDIFTQYEECAKLLKQIPATIKLIICAGNHDAMRIAEPQPELYKDFAKHIWELNNAVMVSNPAMVNIHSSENFSGFDVLMYHGYSFDYYVANVDSIRNQGGYDRADLIMKFLLQKRHLAPTHASTLYIPDANQDPLVIDKIPDFFVAGHIHKSSISTYRNTTLICGSCWQSKTPFQEKVGHNPEPCKVPVVNLRTREAKILKF